MTGQTASRAALRGALAVGLLAAGCAPRDYYVNTQAQLDSLLVVQGAIMRHLASLDRKVESTREGVQSTRASSDTRLTEVAQRLEALEGKFEASDVRFTQLTQKVDAVKQKLSAADSARIAAGGLPDSTLGADPEAMYQAAYSDYLAGRFDLARAAFTEYLRRFPDTEVSDNAQYWLGECLYAVGDFAGAIAEFEKVSQSYPKGDKVPAALLKTGISYARLRNVGEAKRYFETVIKRYPKSDEARLARERLAQKP
ncbi:MAG TPA: tol-pal system protein YbgF [Candidatus Eisenbacteria bacterium]